jgi:peptide/nickel transport system permease protein
VAFTGAGISVSAGMPDYRGTAGVDVLAKMVHGTTVALLVGFVSMGIAGAIGILVGALGGYFGGWIDAVTSRVTEIVMCVPTLVLILAIMAIIEKPTIWHTMAIIGFTGWTGIARLTRGEFLNRLYARVHDK